MDKPFSRNRLWDKSIKPGCLYIVCVLMSRILWLWVPVCLFFIAGCDKKQNITTLTPTSVISQAQDKTVAPSYQVSTLCPQGTIKPVNGQRKLALIVGIGAYKKASIPDLHGASADAKRMYTLLTDPAGLGFPKDNVCLLQNEDATLTQVIDRFQQHLVGNAKRGDTVVFYYAGHGSQVQDQNQDEADGLDETFVLYDSRTNDNAGKRIADLRDDTFNGLLAQLSGKTKNITVILDSCSSGTATRAKTQFVSRYIEPDASVVAADAEAVLSSDVAQWIPADQEGLVTLSAAVDGTPAWERDGKGIFTDALVYVLAQMSEPLTYQQVALRVAALVKAESQQKVQFHGDLQRPIFEMTTAKKPLLWQVTDIGKNIRIAGLPMPGMGAGAELRVFNGNVASIDLANRLKSKALLQVLSTDGLQATASVLWKTVNATELQLGDVVTLIRPGMRPLQIAFGAGVVAESRVAALKNTLARAVDEKQLVEFSDRGEFVLTMGSDGKLELRGSDGKVKIRYQNDADVIPNLVSHAKQRAILRLTGDSSGDQEDNRALEVQVVPASQQDLCAAHNVWRQSAPNSTQIIPLCHRWNIRVTASVNALAPMNVGGVILSSDGSIYGFPADGRSALISPGQSLTFSARRETFKAIPPLETEDQVLVFGVDPNMPVAWHRLTAASRSAGASVLEQQIKRLINTPMRTLVSAPAVTPTTWTHSIVPIVVEANARFFESPRGKQAVENREYTLNDFDVRPYLPDDTDSALYNVLSLADALARSARRDGYSYKQHAWKAGSDIANLTLGIDCSRAIWYAFTRAGLRYNKRNDAYLPTADMVTKKTPMQDYFNLCPANKPFQIGDVLVYRDTTRGDGHVVMVIDPAKRIAWGSHGWDGNPKILPVEPDTGVEYQKIKIKTDWIRWDRSTMMLQKCWRYTAFSKNPELGSVALQHACDERVCKLQ